MEKLTALWRRYRSGAASARREEAAPTQAIAVTRPPIVPNFDPINAQPKGTYLITGWGTQNFANSDAAFCYQSLACLNWVLDQALAQSTGIRLISHGEYLAGLRSARQRNFTYLTLNEPEEGPAPTGQESDYLVADKHHENGWKFHVNIANAEDMPTTWNIVQHILIKHRVGTIKFANRLQSGESLELGAYITIYAFKETRSLASWKDILSEITLALDHQQFAFDKAQYQVGVKFISRYIAYRHGGGANDQYSTEFNPSGAFDHFAQWDLDRELNLSTSAAQPQP